MLDWQGFAKIKKQTGNVDFLRSGNLTIMACEG